MGERIEHAAPSARPSLALATLGLRREPSRILFPLGTAMAWLGVLPWLLFSLNLQAAVRPIYRVFGYRTFFHPLAELEGFLTCFATGLLFTLLPRFTDTAPPSAGEVLAAVAAPIASVLLTALDHWNAAQAATVLVLLVALQFTLRRVGRSNNALWIPFAIALGAAGAGLAAAAPPEAIWLRELGRDLVLQGAFSALALGAARMLRGDDGNLGTHLLSAACFAASFWAGARYGQHIGFALRALACLPLARPLRLELARGPLYLRRAFAHLALWLLVFGYGWASVSAGVRRAGLHVIFVGSFSALLLAALNEARASARLLAATAALFAFSTMARAMVELDPSEFHLWMGISAASFLAASVLSALISLRLGPITAARRPDPQAWKRDPLPSAKEQTWPRPR